MAGPITISETNTTTQFAGRSNYRFALISLTTLFFMWGFITSLNDVLIPYLKDMFELNYTQAMLIQFCFFGAYFIVSIPAGSLVSKVGYKNGILVGLTLAACGCLLFYPAAEYRFYSLFLAALFVLASGITILQVSANPYVSALGDPEKSSARLTLAQAFNSLGTTVSPIWIGPIILASIALTQTSESTIAEVNRAVQLPYLLLAATLFLLALMFAFLRLPAVDEHQVQQNTETSESVLKHRHLFLGAIAIFVYVGAEVGIGSFLVNFLSMPSIGNMHESEASKFIGYYFGGAMIGRFIGAAVMHHVAANKVLAFNSMAAIILLIVTIFSSGALAMWSIVFVGLFNSIMFPTIFTLAIKNLGPLTSKGAGVLCLAIVGDAILPLLQGISADLIGIQLAFFIPVICYFYITFYGLKGFQVRT